MAIRSLKKLLHRLLRNYLLGSEDPQQLEFRHQGLLRLAREIDDKTRRVKARSLTPPPITSVDGGTPLGVHVQDEAAPWRTLDCLPDTIPGMITDQECQYYTWIGRFYSGRGDVVELGPWLGKSTRYILRGLKDNPRFTGRKLHVFDDFTWRASWMNNSVPAAEQLADGQDFRFLFEKYLGDLLPDVAVEQRHIISQGDGEHVRALEQWNRGPIEILYVDCGRTFEVNEGWYRLFSKSFIPGRTIILMQDWRLHREVPVQWYNQTKEFTDSKGAHLTLIHEVTQGGLAAFLFRG